VAYVGEYLVAAYVGEYLVAPKVVGVQCSTGFDFLVARGGERLDCSTMLC
jgi:hypothetical protein